MNLKALKQADYWIGSVLAILFTPLAWVARKVARRDHAPEIRGQLVVVKILGGGSLLIALPALLALRDRYPDTRITLLCSPAVKKFAELAGVFDDYAVISTDRAGGFLLSCLHILRMVFRADTIINFEMHSKLTSVFCLLTLARNRIGLTLSWNQWQNNLSTHSFFYNDSSPIYLAYFQIARALGGTIPSMEETARRFRARNGLEEAPPAPPDCPRPIVALAPYCSDLVPEREFSDAEWAVVLKTRHPGAAGTILVLGGPADKPRAARTQAHLGAALPGWRVIDLAGKESLTGSARWLTMADELLTIDSGVNHIARLLPVPITSYWGPTDPYRRLAAFTDTTRETVLYRKCFCSPCVHTMDTAPCRGNNICMKQHIAPPDTRAAETGWLIRGDAS
ncbi:ADP-heptose:LPS heptosyltransferase [Azospirillum agricola]|uniref:glycosyltransferase family 9 protein n=1 Tax=Azospirillum agricola TaxID=1720247 RepID=UPI001AEA1C10|nr:glycosyltransferase family 9 protein [Azospirillum agricola]MBP2232983.1 ADP-heptose:LPS heptosyltransferase [Azospirillum agricola]